MPSPPPSRWTAAHKTHCSTHPHQQPPPATQRIRVASNAHGVPAFLQHARMEYARDATATARIGVHFIRAYCPVYSTGVFASVCLCVSESVLCYISVLVYIWIVCISSFTSLQYPLCLMLVLLFLPNADAVTTAFCYLGPHLVCASTRI